MADRYAFTAFARDTARGVDPEWVRKVYSFAVQPDIAFYFRVPLDVAVGRILGARASIKYYEAGMDIGLSDDIVESFKLFQARIMGAYDSMVEEFGLTVVDGTLSIKQQQDQVRDIFTKTLGDWQGLSVPAISAGCEL
jgi:dTMP kinase